MKKRKFVSPCFHRTNAGWHTGRSAPSATRARKIRQEKQIVVSASPRNNCALSFGGRQIQLAAD
jgi:hypothetical protein